jgi:5'-deoxynucleotidase YfbR-like HD superfamily hydrolase
MEIVKTKHVVGKPKHIKTATGIDFYPFKPEIEKINIEDIAHSLSQQCRFSGHTKWKGKMKFYSVAQHSLYCSYISENPLWALLHDASEAYSVDVPTPIKKRIPQFKYMEEKIESVIASAFNLEWPRPSEVKECDIKAFNIEWHLLMLNDESSEEYKKCSEDKLFMEILDMTPEQTKDAFINRFKELNGSLFRQANILGGYDLVDKSGNIIKRDIK